jgi:ABC-type polysaccharide/polyol phosphate export permease
VAFWFVPIFYLASFVPPQYKGVYLLNPITALVMSMRNVLLDGQAPPNDLMFRFMLVSLGTLGLGMLLFRQMKSRFYDYL